MMPSVVRLRQHDFLRDQAQLGSLSAAQRQAVERRIAADVVTMTQFVGLLNSTAISADERALAITQMVMGYAANHRVNTVCLSYLTAKQQVEAQKLGLTDAEADDYYLYASDIAAGLI